MKRSLFLIALIPLLVGSSAQEGGASGVTAGLIAPEQTGQSSQSRYTVTDLGTLGGVTTKGLGINDDGQITGVSQSGLYMYAFLWDDSTMTNLGDLSGRGSWAYDVNETGQVVGGSFVDDQFQSHAFLWQNNVMQDLGTLGGPSSYALEINNSGQTVGYACCAPETYVTHAVLWGSGGIVDLGDMDPEWPVSSAAYGINDAGQVVGNSYTADPLQSVHAFLWHNGRMQDLGTLGGDYSSAEAINENGQVVGTARLANSTAHAFLWDGGMHDLGSLTWDQSIAYDINDKGQVVGALQTGQNSHAFIWADGRMEDLNNLIPQDSGWVLNESHAINDKGQIVGFGTIIGQTRAFLLEPGAYHWVNPGGGSWHVDTNWDPQGIPAEEDVAVFDLSGNYEVNVSSKKKALSGSSFTVDRVIVSSTNIVKFNNMDLNMVYDSPEKPSLEVNDGATAHVFSGTATFSHATIGGKAPGNPSNPPTAHLQVVGQGTSLTGTGRLTVGDEGMGDVFVTGGGHLVSAETRLGGLLPPAYGEAEVSGDGSYWKTGNIAVGYNDSAKMVIRGGARVDSDDAFISYGIFSEYSQVTIDGAGASQSSLWALQGSLTIGQNNFGTLEAINGADLYVSEDVNIRDGELKVDGRLPNGDLSEFDVSGNVFVGGPGSANLLALWNAARGGIEGNLILGMDGKGDAILWGAAYKASTTQLDVVNPQAGLCAIGRSFDGGIGLDDGGYLRCRNIEVGGRPGMNGSGWLTVDGGMVRALDVLTVGFDGGGRGLIEMMNNAVVATNGTYIATPGDTIKGTGTLSVNFLGLQNDGTLEPGIKMLYPKKSTTSSSHVGQTQEEPATLFVDGTLKMGPTGRLVIPVTGSDPGQYGSLAVSDTAHLNGVLSLNFSGGYLPHEGDSLILLTVEGVLTGAFDSVEVNGLAPGFEYEISATGGQLSLKALNNANTTNTDPLVSGSSLLAVGAYPNPFSNSTNISFRLEKESHLRIRVFTVTGAVVRTLEDGLVSAGDQVRTWDGRDNWGHDVSSGVYFCVVEGPGEWVTRKLVRVL